MEKRSLVKEIRNAMNTGAQINVRAYSVTDEGADVVETDLLNIWEPLRANSVFGKIGAKMYGNLKGDCQIPVMSAGNVGWASELGAAQDGSGAFTSVTLKPKRLTCKVPISLQLLAQDSIDVESAIRADIIAAVQDKFEATVFGTEAGDTTKPAGLFNGYVDDSTKIETFADIADLEADIEEGNFGAIKYVMSPKAKAALRTMIKGTNATGMVYENNAVDGVEAFTTTNVPAGKLIAGDFSQLVIGEWADMTLDVCRDSASLANGCVTLVLNMFVDAELVREGAVAPANI